MSDDTPMDGVIRISKVDIEKSPVLSVTCGDQTVHLVIDTGAEANLMNHRKAKSLKVLSLKESKQKLVQADGDTPLEVLGEIHAIFEKGDHELNFNGLLVKDLASDVIAGAPFLAKNDIFVRKKKNTSQWNVHIGDKSVFLSTPPSILDFSKFKSSLLSTARPIKVLRGEVLEFDAPSTVSDNEEIYIEPLHGKEFFLPHSLSISDNKIRIENTEHEVLQLKNGAQVARVSRAFHQSSPELEGGSRLTIEDINTKMTEVVIDQAKTFKGEDQLKLKNIIEENSCVLGDNLPGYNGTYGPVNASIEFTTQARPVPQKAGMPAYGSKMEQLYNTKCKEMIDKGILIDPFELGIQPALINNSWLVKKPSSAGRKLEQLGPNDVRLVTAFNHLNQFLRPIPPKVTKPEKIYTSIAKWKYMGELDFRDMYWQIPFLSSSKKDKDKLSYLAIRTAWGTKVYSTAAMGLLGMDAIEKNLRINYLVILYIKASW